MEAGKEPRDGRQGPAAEGWTQLWLKCGTIAKVLDCILLLRSSFEIFYAFSFSWVKSSLNYFSDSCH